MKEEDLDYVLVPLGVAVLVTYHVWLLYTIKCSPSRTCIGINAKARHKWVYCLMSDPLKNGVLAVQTLRNNIMATTVLATASITLSSLISVYVSNISDTQSSQIVYGNKSSIMSSIKFFAISFCFLVAFLCNVQSTRYYAHVSFLVSVPTFRDRRDSIEYVARNLNRGSFFWSLGLRAFYFSFPLFLWIFGPIPMFLCSCIMSFVLYFLDITTSLARDLHSLSLEEEAEKNDEESIHHSSIWTTAALYLQAMAQLDIYFGVLSRILLAMLLVVVLADRKVSSQRLKCHLFFSYLVVHVGSRF